MSEALETDPRFECAGQAPPDGWAFSWLGEPGAGVVDLGGAVEGDGIEVARLVVSPGEVTLCSADRRTLRVVASHVERELGRFVSARLPQAA